ncbi:MAG: SDR family NAD(P)-dependent oxidoreductase [Acidobacteriota bacterium]|nr:SDR family NAD(P)-dependent oxidoreductase [Acidobacteriota bacterium]
MIMNTTEHRIAIVGMGLRFPDAKTPAAFWDNLCRGRESVRFLDDDTLRANGVSEEQLADPNYVRAAVVLDDIDRFDADFFGLGPKEAAVMDPQHRLFLTTAWEALEDAGHPPDRFDGAVGVFAGCGMAAYFAFNVLRNPALLSSEGLFLLRHTGNDKDFLATRASYNFNLTGPSINIQTACSTSLVAAHTACQSLLSYECDLALAGGVTIEIPHGRGYLFKQGEILSPDGHCRAFDHRARGTIFGSGAGVVALRRLEDALADGDRIYAVIRGSAVNNDGSAKVGYLAPSVEGQAAAVVEALEMAGTGAARVGYVECHGTGTAVGDPIEISALTQAFRLTTTERGYCAVGSVKTNIGHLDTAAGVAALMKTALSLHHGKIPPSLNYRKANPAIDFDNSPFFVNDRLTDWSEETPLACVNSLGVGGTNAHVVLEGAPQPTSPPAASGPYLFRLSAKSRKALDAACDNLADYLEANPQVEPDTVTQALHRNRKAFEYRRVLAVDAAENTPDLLRRRDPERVFLHRAGETSSVPVVFMFPGGGAQYPGMSRGLYESEAEFRRWIDRGLAHLETLIEEDLRSLLFPTDDEAQADERLKRPALQLPLIFLVEYALAKLWMSRGFQPEALIGHSMGQNTAACLAGVCSFEDGLGLVTLRGQLFERCPTGGMLSTALPAEELGAMLPAELDLAVVNGLDSSVVSGPEALLQDFAKTLQAREIDFQVIPITVAAHSRMLDAILPDFRAYLQSIRLKAPQIPIVANRDGHWLTAAQAVDPDYWADHLRRTVRFDLGLDELLSKEGRTFLEVGPGRILGSLVRRHPKAKNARGIIPSLRHRNDQLNDTVFFQTAVGRLWACGVEGETPDTPRRHLTLPTYPFQEQSYWIEPSERDTADEAMVRQPMSDWFHVPEWERHEAIPTVKGEPDTWLVMLDRAGVGLKLADRLKAAGHRVVGVAEGDTFCRLEETLYTLSPEQGVSGYIELIRSLVSEGLAPTRVAHLQALTADETFRPGSSLFHGNMERGFYSLFFLAKAIGQECPRTDIHFVTVTNGSMQVGDEELRYPEKAALTGPCMMIPREYPGACSRLVDVDMPQNRTGFLGNRLPLNIPENLLDQIMLELTIPPDNDIVAWRKDGRFRRTYGPWRRNKTRKGLTPRKGGTYLITGGAGGIGMALADHLARNYQANLVLTQRAPWPEEQDWDHWLNTHARDNRISAAIRAVRAMEAAGGKVLVQQADVADLEAMQTVTAAANRRFGKLHGIFHAAGVLHDAPIQMKTQSEIEDVFAPKLHGTLVLDQLPETDDLDFLVLFSSTSAAVPPAGQVDYCAANAWLNAYARRKPNAYAVAWGPWSQVGMAARMVEASRQGAGPHAEPFPVTHPLIERRVTDSRGFSELSGELSTRFHWVVDEHRTLNGRALLPGTAYLELVRTALAEQGETRPFSMRDLVMLRPLFTAEDREKKFRVKLKPEQEGYRLTVQSLWRSSEGWETHAECALQPAPSPRETSIPLAGIRARCSAEHEESKDGIRTGQWQHLNLGPRWQVLREIYWGQGEALAHLELPAFAADECHRYHLHPALLDMATGFAMKLIQDYRPEDGLWVPVSYRGVNFRGRLPHRIWSWVRSASANRAQDGVATFDIVLIDEDGAVLLEVDSFTIKKMTAPLVPLQAPQPNELEPVEDKRNRQQPTAAEQRLQRQVNLGIRPEEGAAVIETLLEAGAPPEVLVSPLSLDILKREAERAGASEPRENRFTRPDLEGDYTAPADDIERTLVGFWEELLGIEGIGVEDSFFELGGHSLIAVRLFARVKQVFHVSFPISVLFEASTIRGCAELIREAGVRDRTADSAGPAHRHTHLVAMHSGKPGPNTPFFLVAGMFGNVLNLRHLAHLIGTDRPFYGLQARGLFGGDAPHNRFDEMAADYLAEIKSVQPEGPYLLGGFSGGGITAFEMARQLIEAGESVDLLAFLDTPLPHRPSLQRADKLKIHWQRLREDNLNYLWSWAQDRIAWELNKRKPAGAEDRPGETEYHSLAIEAGFREALAHYRLQKLPCRLNLFRPPLDKRFNLGGERFVSSEKEFVSHDNGWTPYVDSLEVHEVPGDHDSMVLEPNVRALAGRLARAIARAEREREHWESENKLPAPSAG